MTEVTQRPMPPQEAVTKYNDLLRQHGETKITVLNALREGNRDREAEARMADFAREFNELLRQYDFSPPRSQLQAVVDALTSDR